MIAGLLIRCSSYILLQFRILVLKAKKCLISVYSGVGLIDGYKGPLALLRFFNKQSNQCNYALRMSSLDNEAIASQQSSYSSSSSINVKLDNVKNMRDISTAKSSYIKPNKIIRTGCVSKASDEDVRVCHYIIIIIIPSI